ncbi:MAG: endolytic transglycosylase MltG [Proteobacteria bacterium]|nr:endolytic transglycosylase MltG [Pseudomonadota bacterium]
MIRGAVWGAAAVALAGLALLAWAAQGLHAPAAAAESAQSFTVEAGDTPGRVASRLERSGLLPPHPIFGPRAFALYARLAGADRAIKAGEYELDARMTPAEILDKLVSGEVKTHPVTLPEGLRLDEIAGRLEAAGIVSAESFIAHARDPARARGRGIAGDSFEGYLYPETYRFRRGSTPEEVIGRMHDEFGRRWTEADREALAASGHSLHEIVTLASIVEKESALPAERTLVSAVFANRLARGMLLQTDPTVIYGIIATRGEFDGNLRRSDLERDTPYNTYVRAGLPPGPIASASIESIRAALSPADVPYLYFVSRNDGTHVFSRTLREHTQAVDRYQRRRGRRS